MAERNKPPAIDVATGGQNSAADTPVSVGGCVSAAVPDPVTKDGFLEKQVHAVRSARFNQCVPVPASSRASVWCDTYVRASGHA